MQKSAAFHEMHQFDFCVLIEVGFEPKHTLV